MIQWTPVIADALGGGGGKRFARVRKSGLREKNKWFFPKHMK